jgi:hypothetical protein
MWRPIETAPENQTVLVYPSGRARTVTIGWREKTMGKKWVNGRETIGWFSYHAELACMRGECALEYDDIWPTHWMPLPDPPTTQTAA